MPLIPIINLFVEFGPIAVFFGAYQVTGNFFTAVIAFVISAFFAVVVAGILERRIPLFPLISALPIIIFGVPSYFLHNADLFIVRETIADVVFALIIMGSLATPRPLLKRCFNTTFALTNAAWRSITIRWGIFYLILATLNEIVRQSFTEDVWVYYKMATVVATLLFALYQFTLAAKWRIPEESNRLGLRTHREDGSAHLLRFPFAKRDIVKE